MGVPYFLVYSGDLQKHLGYRRISRDLKGLYLDLLLLMNEGSERGVLIINEQPLTKAEIAGVVGGDYDGTLRALEELLRVGLVAVRKDGALYSPEMVAQENERQETAKRKRKQRARDTIDFPPDGDECHSDVTPDVTSKSHTTSSSSSSSYIDSTNVESKGENSAEVVRLSEHKAKSNQAKPKRSNPFYEYFAFKYQELRKHPYISTQADFIQLAALNRKCLNNKWEMTEARWKRTVDNYFCSEVGKPTMAHLCTQFQHYFLNPLDRYGQPISQTSQQSRATGTIGQKQINAANTPKDDFVAHCVAEFQAHKYQQKSQTDDVVEGEIVE